MYISLYTQLFHISICMLLLHAFRLVALVLQARFCRWLYCCTFNLHCARLLRRMVCYGSLTVFKMVFVRFSLWFSYCFMVFLYGFCVVFVGFSFGFLMVFIWFSWVSFWFSCGFLKVSLRLSLGLFLVFLWLSCGFPMVFLWFSFILKQIGPLPI